MIDYLVVESVGNFVADHKPDSTVIHITRPIIGEKYALQDTSWEFWKYIEDLKLTVRLSTEYFGMGTRKNKINDIWQVTEIYKIKKKNIH